MYFFFSPLEQFDVLPLFSFFHSSKFLVITNVNFFLFVVLSISFSFLFLSFFSSTLVPNAYQSLVEQLYSFVYGFSRESLGAVCDQYFSYLFTLFFFVLSSNVLGLVPYSFTLTSQLVVTFCLGFGSFFGLNWIGIRKHGLHLLSFFLPKGAPIALAPFLVLIEIISYVFRLFSLSIRLFANMFAGHTLLNILAGFSIMLFPGVTFIGFFPWLGSIIPLVVVFAVMGLELGIAFLQAYVFTILTCLYLNDALVLH